MQFFKLLWTFFVMAKNKTHEQFLEELREKNEHFREGRFIVVGMYELRDKRILIRSKAGEALISPKTLLRGNVPVVVTIIDDFIKVHGDTYDYSKVNYIGSSKKVIIGCKIHGDFEQTTGSHLYGSGCNTCGTLSMSNKRSLPHDVFVENVYLKNKYYRNGDFKIISNYICQSTKLLVKDRYGECLVEPNSLLRGSTPTILSAVDKTKYIIEKFREIHGDTYGYAEVEYIDSQTNVTLICPTHGPFYKQPNNIMQNQGCPHCSGSSNIDNHSFILRAKDKHGSKYTYPNLNVSSNTDKIEVICPLHGHYTQKVRDHLNGTGCLVCGRLTMIEKQSKTLSQFITEAKEIHGDKWTYEDVVYINSSTKVNLGCRVHGQFSATPDNILYSKSGCPRCGDARTAALTKYSTADFIKKAIELHGELYDYSAVDYINWHHKVSIKCNKHGVFLQAAGGHLSGYRCPTCSSEFQGWTDTKWKNRGLKSINFDSFKVYIIKCWDENEEFYKIGKSFRSMKKRFLGGYTARLPYNYEVIKIFEDKEDGVKMSKLERQLHLENKEHKYTPKTEFKGMYECFSKINEETLNFKLDKNIEDVKKTSRIN